MNQELLKTKIAFLKSWHLVSFWLGDYSKNSGPYNGNNSYDKYDNGIRYFTDYIAHLETKITTPAILPELLKEPIDEVLDV